MRVFLLLFLIMTSTTFAANSVDCEIVDGIYKNSTAATLQDLRFETLVDIFTITNAKTVALTINGEELKFFRSSINVERQTIMTYLLRKNGKAVRAAYIIIDRTPRKATKDREFFGNIVLSSEIKDESELIELGFSARNLVYNFHCQI